ncbi:hypothetical protein [Noviherbaspirillum saxi]|uniref:Uncharacterized protein n=1 Tax=Noviherbaspirillum saxi TaxID=2320863 RepID=A0A3A3FQM4_9BURK|nr:hypothetical protein [Noviherbaspirillum saxi]RJF98517.1 hypothetical protein D3871_08345 [Noviherbaspirillum saxi]
MHAFIIKTKDGYLYPFAGDLSLTDDENQAGRYDSVDEARQTAESRGYYDGGFDIVRIDLESGKTARH